MIDFVLGETRLRRFSQLANIVTPPTRVQELLTYSGRLALPIRYAQDCYDWLREGHGRIGLGFHDTLWEAESALNSKIYKLETHPAMRGYGMLGRKNTMPLSCWQHEVVHDIPLCNINGIGTEGFLVPLDARFSQSDDHFTFWTFLERAHGKPWLRENMFISEFTNGNNNEKDAFAAKKTAERKAKFGKQ